MKNNTIYILDERILTSERRRFVSCILDLFFVFITIFLSGLIVVAVGNIFNWDIFSIWDRALVNYTYLVCFGFLILNYFVMEYFFGRSFGKLIMGTIVVNENGLKPGFQFILIRTLCRLIPFDALSFLGESGRIWHDSLSKTYVVNRKALKEEIKLFSDLNLIGNNELN